MLFLHLLFPKGDGIIDPAFGAGSSPKSKAVTQTGIHMKLRVDPGLLHGFEPRLHDPPAGDAVPVTDTGIGGRIAFGILAQSTPPFALLPSRPIGSSNRCPLPVRPHGQR